MRLESLITAQDIFPQYMLFPPSYSLFPTPTRDKNAAPGISHTIFFKFLLSLILCPLPRHLLMPVSARECLRLAQVLNRGNLESKDEGEMRLEMDLFQTYPHSFQDSLE